MSRRLFVIFGVLCLTLGLLCSCGSTKTASNSESEEPAVIEKDFFDTGESTKDKTEFVLDNEIKVSIPKGYTSERNYLAETDEKTDMGAYVYFNHKDKDLHIGISKVLKYSLDEAEADMNSIDTLTDVADDEDGFVYSIWETKAGEYYNSKSKDNYVSGYLLYKDGSYYDISFYSDKDEVTISDEDLSVFEDFMKNDIVKVK